MPTDHYSSRNDVTVAISTVGSRVLNIELPLPLSGLIYLLLVQDAPSSLPNFDRPDVRIVTLSGRGLSNSRNAALDLCTTSYLLFCDDDLALRPEGILELTNSLIADSQLGIAVGWRAGRSPLPRKHRLRWYNAGHVCAPEFLVRCAAIRAGKIRFDADFGVGAKHPIGEDYIFVCDLLRSGIRGSCVPVITGDHPSLSSGDKWTDPELTQARKAMLQRCFGLWALPARVLYAVKHRRRLGGVCGVFRFIVP